MREEEQDTDELSSDRRSNVLPLEPKTIISAMQSLDQIDSVAYNTSTTIDETAEPPTAGSSSQPTLEIVVNEGNLYEMVTRHSSEHASKPSHETKP